MRNKYILLLLYGSAPTSNLHGLTTGHSNQFQHYIYHGASITIIPHLSFCSHSPEPAVPVGLCSLFHL